MRETPIPASCPIPANYRISASCPIPASRDSQRFEDTSGDEWIEEVRDEAVPGILRGVVGGLLLWVILIVAVLVT